MTKKYTAEAQVNAYKKAEDAMRTNEPLTTLTNAELEAASEWIDYLWFVAECADSYATTRREQAHLAPIKRAILEAHGNH